MSGIITAVIVSVITSAMTFVAFMVLRKKLVASSGTELSTLLGEIKTTEEQLENILQYTGAYGSPRLVQSIETQLTEENNALVMEKARLKEVELKLEQAQKNVEQKESSQQEAKTAREEDDQKLKELLAKYQDISNESISLERKLAASLKNLESIMSEVQVTDEQKATLNELLQILTDGSAQLRELLLESQVINDRLIGLQTQFKDLEEEYTKLVEQQLGE